MILTIRLYIANLLLRLSRRIAATKQPVSYVGPDGVVVVPPRIVKDLGLEKGGSVCFVRRKDGIVEMLTGEQYGGIFGGEE